MKKFAEIYREYNRQRALTKELSDQVLEGNLLVGATIVSVGCNSDPQWRTIKVMLRDGRKLRIVSGHEVRGEGGYSSDFLTVQLEKEDTCC